ncbi:MAG TPA: hypothetical protein VNA24_11895 [Hyalangium sp.]|nr:hypothetical protein [Hyalangium sp.]
MQALRVLLLHWMHFLLQQALLASLLLLLGACAGVERRGAPRVYAQGFDTESNACLRFPGNCPGAQGTPAGQKVAEAGATLGSIGAALFAEDKAQQNRIAEAILDCVKDADFTLNERSFGGNPSREQCAEVLGRDTSGNPVTRAMLLGREKHSLALECVQQKLQEIRPKGFSLNQRYKENKATGRWEPLSEQQVQSLLRNGGDGLIGTIVPDVVIHTGNLAEVLDVFDLKFPCPGTNPARWHNYAKGTPHHPLNQGELYEKAFRINPARVAPRWDIQRLRPK